MPSLAISALQTIQMKCQALFSLKKSTSVLPGAVVVSA